MRVAELVAYFGQLKGLEPHTTRLRAKEMLERFDLGDWLDKRCEALSKGMRQKVQILITLLHEPDLVIFDAATVIDNATWEDPHRYPDGIHYVFVNGTAVVRAGLHTQARPGRVLRRGAA